MVVVPKTFLSEILTAAHACGCSLLAPQCCLPTMSEDEARRLVEKMSIHNQRWLMVAEGTFTGPRPLKAGEKLNGPQRVQGIHSDDLPADQVYRLAVLAMKKRLERGEKNLPRAEDCSL